MLASQQQQQPQSSAPSGPGPSHAHQPPTAPAASGGPTPTSATAAIPFADEDSKGKVGYDSFESAPPPSNDDDTKPRVNDDKDATETSTAPKKSFSSTVQDLWKRAMRYDEENFIYSLRIAVAMFVSALFTLVNPGTFVFPQTPWILASTAVVGWQNTLDTATAVKRAIERTAGTAIGATLGLAVGFVSLPLQFSKPGQATLLGFTTTAFCLFMPYFTANVGLRGSYAARLCLVSYSIVSLSFYTSNEPCHPPGWYMGVWRAINIMLGCFIGAASLVIHPRSMKSMIVKRVRNQVKTVGESTCQVLGTACESFTDHSKRLPHWDEIVTGKGGGVVDGGGGDVAKFESDPAYVAYISGAHGWKDCNELFAMLKYDHTLFSMSKDEKKEFRLYMTVISHRVFRMHTNLVVLASIVRGAAPSIVREMSQREGGGGASCGGKEGADDVDPGGTFDALRGIGRRIQVLLDCTASADDRTAAFKTLVGQDLALVGRLVSKEQEASVKRRQQMSQDGTMDETLEQLQGMLLTKFDIGNRQNSPLEHIESHQQVSLFFLLVEHLIIRATCLYQLLRPELYDK
jgi:Fusaric acid resistance protein-like